MSTTTTLGRVGAVLLALSALVFCAAAAPAAALAGNPPDACPNHAQHDAACGYVQAAGSPCTHSCALCAAPELTASPQEGAEQEQVEEAAPAKTVSAFAPLSAAVQIQAVEPGAGPDDLTLPGTLLATVDNAENTEITGVTWTCAAYSAASGMAEGEYEWAAILPGGYALAEGLNPPGCPLAFGTGGGNDIPAACG